MKGSRSTWTLLLAALLLALVPGVALADGVVVNASVVGTPGPNRTVRGEVDIDITDGSTLRSVAWTQVFGAPARLTPQGNNVRVKLAPAWRYRNELVEVLQEPPIGPDQLPPNVPLPPGEFPGGLQDRWQVVGLNPFALEEGGLVRLRVTVVTTSGTYTDEAEIQVHLPFSPTAGLNNVPIDVPVLLHGKEQESYNWTLVRPSGSEAVLDSATTRNPAFTPDVPGNYVVRVTDLEEDEEIELAIYAGTWRGVIVDQDAAGQPVSDNACTNCHGAFAEDNFEPWAETGHAEIFETQLNTSTHYGPSCFSCHTVGYDPNADNGGMDEAADYDEFLASGLLNHPGDNWTTVLEEFPETAMKANIQCENCHGPQVQFNDTSDAHGLNEDVVGDPRISISSDVCATCHGEPLRHARFQQWQLSGHANYELAIDEGESGSCARCHTGNGFLKWVPVLNGEVPGDPLANITVDWDVETETHPQTCVTCHDPHANGNTSGVDTNATVRISGDTPRLIAGFKATAVGAGAICMTCHNTRRGLYNDDTFGKPGVEEQRAPHPGAQADVLMGENAFLVETGIRGAHSFVEDTCVNCHMERTPPPDDLAYQQGGSNHTFYARPEICNDCHKGLEVNNLQHAFETLIHELGEDIADYMLHEMDEQIQMGYTIDLNSGKATIRNVAHVAKLELTEGSGGQGINVTFTNGGFIGPVGLNNVRIVRPGQSTIRFYEAPEVDNNLSKAFWNYLLLESDGSKGVHNPTWVLTVIDASRDAVGGGGSGTPRRLTTDDLRAMAALK
jgi:hypothetical protein